MKTKKGIVLCFLMTILLGVLMFFGFNNLESYDTATPIYQVYLDGEKIGLITSKQDLYSMINKEQVEIKDQYKVDQVYPPKGFKIIRMNTYDKEITSTEKIYDSIKDDKEFTVKGYTITIKSKEEGKAPIYIYVLDQDVFKEAIEMYVKTFIGEERYKQYKEGTQPEIVETGYTINTMSIEENISIKESLIGVNEKIYTDPNELTRFLLFGENNEEKLYTVAQGDTISSIAEANKLNTIELILANNKTIKSENTLLAIGQELNVALIKPVISLVYEETIVEDKEILYQTIYEDDNTKTTDYRFTKQAGSKGLQRETKLVRFVNGDPNSGAVFVGDPVVLRPAQNEIIVKGTRPIYVAPIIPQSYGTYVDTGDTWGWPTNSPYMITSGYGYRWGALHDGIDISGTGYGSPIYAALDGVVVSSQYGGMVGSSAGYNIVIEHSNGYYTVYAHCSALYAHVGQYVSRGEVIAAMGHTGAATGTHLHFGLFYGKPYNGGYSLNPLRLWK